MQGSIMYIDFKKMAVGYFKKNHPRQKSCVDMFWGETESSVDLLCACLKEAVGDNPDKPTELDKFYEELYNVVMVFFDCQKMAQKNKKEFYDALNDNVLGLCFRHDVRQQDRKILFYIRYYLARLRRERRLKIEFGSKSKSHAKNQVAVQVYARMWRTGMQKKYRGLGQPITKEYLVQSVRRNCLSRAKAFRLWDIVIANKGFTRGIGEVYFRGLPVGAGAKARKLSPLKYRILLEIVKAQLLEYELDLPTLISKAWLSSKHAEDFQKMGLNANDLRADEIKRGHARITLQRKIADYGSTLSKLNKFLRPILSVEIASGGTGYYRFTKQLKLCLFQISPNNLSNATRG